MDKNWVEHLISEYSSGLLKYLKNHTRSAEDAEDLAQDVYVSVYEHAAEFDPEQCNEQAWLYIIAKRKLVDYYRKYRLNESLDAMEEWEVPGVDSMAQADNVMAARQAVAKGLSRLDERSRKIVIMRYFDGLDSTEVAERMNLSVANVRTLLSRALDTMQKTIGNFNFEE